MGTVRMSMGAWRHRCRTDDAPDELASRTTAEPQVTVAARGAMLEL
jgi:hypothetical protein